MVVAGDGDGVSNDAMAVLTMGPLCLLPQGSAGSQTWRTPSRLSLPTAEADAGVARQQNLSIGVFGSKFVLDYTGTCGQTTQGSELSSQTDLRLHTHTHTLPKMRVRRTYSPP